MKILYGVQCTGNGHITRSLKIINRLKNLGHTVDILLSGKNYNKKIPFNVKYRFKGFTFFNTANGGIDYLRTAMSLRIFNFLRNIHIDLSEYDKVISDFEPITAWACKLSNKKCYGISNQYSFTSNKVPRSKKSIIGEFILKWMAPVSVSIGLHYKEYDENIFKPIINDDIINANTNNYGHYTVYLPSYSLSKIVEILSFRKDIFHIFHSDVRSIYRYDNCLIFPMDKNFFLDSFVNCEGIITNAGFQTSSEALYMSKKLMVISTKGQYEQECNVESLKELGIFTGKIEDVESFLISNKVCIKKWEDPIDSILRIILE